MKRERKMQRWSELAGAIGSSVEEVRERIVGTAIVADGHSSPSDEMSLLTEFSSGTSGSAGCEGRGCELHEHELPHEHPSD